MIVSLARPSPPPVATSTVSIAEILLPAPLPSAYARRSATLLAGLAIIGAGDALVVSSHLGNSPFSSVIVATASRLGWSVGSTVIAIGLALVAVAWVVTGRRPGKVAFAAPVVAGTAESIVLPLMHSGSHVVRAFTGVSGLLIIGLGVGVYLGAGLGRAAVESIIAKVVHRTGWTTRAVMVGWHLGCLGIAFAVGGTVGPLTIAFPLVLPFVSAAVIQRSPFVGLA